MALQTSTDGEMPVRAYENPAYDNKETSAEKPTADDKDTSVEIYQNGADGMEKGPVGTDKSAKWYHPASIRQNVRPTNIRQNAEGFADKHPRRTILLIIIGILLICLLICIITGAIVYNSTSSDVSDGSIRMDAIQSDMLTVKQQLNNTDGGWSNWLSWSVCTTSCNGGLQFRNRTCTDPVPTQLGRNCQGNYVDYRMCNRHNCPDKLNRTGPAEKDVYVSPGGRLILNCDVDGPQATVYSWTKRNSCDTYDIYQSIIVAHKAYSGHVGNYTCTAVSPTGDEQAQTISVHYNDTAASGSRMEEKCTFEIPGDLCGWTQDKGDQLDWVAMTGNTRISDSGPFIDKTLFTSYGTYMHIDGRYTHSAESATLRSHLLSANQDLCFTFYYQLNGYNRGALYVYTEDKCTKKRRQIFKTTVSSNAKWKGDTLTVKAASVPNDFYMLITAVATTTYNTNNNGNISIDDLTFTPCPTVQE